MRFATLGSGSRGNAAVVETGGARILVDCGFGIREAEARLSTLGLEPGSLDAVLLTHEHGDHVRGAGALARRHGVPVWSTAGTWRASGCGEVPRLHLFSSHERGFRIGDLRVRPFPVPHDAREPSQFVIEGDGARLGMLTDTGTVTPHAVSMLAECDALLVEFNHDPDMLRVGPYPPSLQARVGGEFGHLSNPQSAGLLDRLRPGSLCWLVAAHLSENNNRPELVRECLVGVAGDLDGRLYIAAQDCPSGWLKI